MAVVEQKDRTAQGDSREQRVFSNFVFVFVHRPSTPCYCNSVTVVASTTIYHIHIEPLDIDA